VESVKVRLEYPAGVRWIHGWFLIKIPEGVKESYRYQAILALQLTGQVPSHALGCVREVSTVFVSEPEEFWREINFQPPLLLCRKFFLISSLAR